MPIFVERYQTGLYLRLDFWSDKTWFQFKIRLNSNACKCRNSFLLLKKKINKSNNITKKKCKPKKHNTLMKRTVFCFLIHNYQLKKLQSFAFENNYKNLLWISLFLCDSVCVYISTNITTLYVNRSIFFFSFWLSVIEKYHNPHLRYTLSQIILS